MSVYVRGDLHGGEVGEINFLTPERYPDLFSSTKEDYLIILGDFGCIWSPARDAKEVALLERLKAFPWTTLFFPGNHENYNRLTSDEFPYVDMFGGQVSKIYDDIYMLHSGYSYIIDNKKVFIRGGATSIDKYRRTPQISWWPQEEPSATEWNITLMHAKAIKEVDYLLTHEMPSHFYRDHLLFRHYMQGYWNQGKVTNSVSDGVEELEKVLSFKKAYCGHHHLDRELNDKWTMLYTSVIRLE